MARITERGAASTEMNPLIPQAHGMRSCGLFSSIISPEGNIQPIKKARGARDIDPTAKRTTILSPETGARSRSKKIIKEIARTITANEAWEILLNGEICIFF